MKTKGTPNTRKAKSTKGARRTKRHVVEIKKDQVGDALHITLTGSIVEDVDFEKLIGAVPSNVTVNTHGVRRMNSIGVKAWVRYFQSLQRQKISLTFEDCSTAITEQINLISNFLCGGTLTSVLVPFSCGVCKHELLISYKPLDLKGMQDEIPAQKCPKCGGEADFDDIPEEYFRFLNR